MPYAARGNLQRLQSHAGVAALTLTWIPANRLALDSREADWKNKLRALNAPQEQCRIDRAVVSEQQRASIMALPYDFPRLWQNPKTPDRVRLLVEDVTLIQNEEIMAHVRFTGGYTGRW